MTIHAPCFNPALPILPGVFAARQTAVLAPCWYPMLCVGFDLLLSGYIAGTILRLGDQYP